MSDELNDPRHAACRDDRRLTRDLAGHRSADIAHDCFLMNCRGLGHEVESLREALIRADAELHAAFDAMDAACKWVAGETAGIKSVADADRHIAGYDALLLATVKAGQAAGVLRRDPVPRV